MLIGCVDCFTPGHYLEFVDEGMQSVVNGGANWELGHVFA